MALENRTAGCGGASGGPRWSGFLPSVQGGTLERQKLSPRMNLRTYYRGETADSSISIVALNGLELP